MERISESEQEEAKDTYDITQNINTLEPRRVSINLVAPLGGPAETGRTKSFISQGPNLLQVPQLSRRRRSTEEAPRRRHSWIPGSR